MEKLANLEKRKALLMQQQSANRDEKHDDKVIKPFIQSPYLKPMNILTWYSLLDELCLHL